MTETEKDKSDLLPELSSEDWTGTTPEAPSVSTLAAPVITVNGELTTGGVAGSQGYLDRESESFVDKDGRMVTRDLEGIDGDVTVRRDESYHGRDGNDKARIVGKNAYADMGEGDDMVAVNMNANETEHEQNQDGSVLKGGPGHDIAFIKMTEGEGMHHETKVNAEGESVTTFTDFGASQSTRVSFTGFEEFRVSVDGPTEKGADPVKSMREYKIDSTGHDKALAAANELREKMNVDFGDDGKGNETMGKNEPEKDVKSDNPDVVVTAGRNQ